MTIFTSYHLEDLLLFSPEVYYRSLALYNQTIWPLPLVAMLISLLFFWLTTAPTHKKTMISGTVLALGWGWCGVVYHMKFYQQINWMAYYYGGIFVAQSILMLVWLIQLSYQAGRIIESPAWGKNSGKSLIAVSLFALPFIGLIDGASIKGGLLFPLSPAPTLLATFGFAMMLEKIPGWLLILPTSYSLIGGLTAYTIGSAQLFAYLLCLAATITLIAKWLTSKQKTSKTFKG